MITTSRCPQRRSRLYESPGAVVHQKLRARLGHSVGCLWKRLETIGNDVNAREGRFQLHLRFMFTGFEGSSTAW